MRLRRAHPSHQDHSILMLSSMFTVPNLFGAWHCVAEIFNLPDLHGALSNYLNHEGPFHSFRCQRRCLPDVHLPFKDLHVWFRVRLQQKSYHDPSSALSTFSVHTHPPDDKWKYGCYDAVILNLDQVAKWPLSGLWGMFHPLHFVLLSIFHRSCCCPCPSHHVSRLPQRNSQPIHKPFPDLCSAVQHCPSS